MAEQERSDGRSGLENLTATAKRRVNNWKNGAAITFALAGYFGFYALSSAMMDENSQFPIPIGVIGGALSACFGAYWGRIYGIMTELNMRYRPKRYYSSSPESSIVE